MHKSDRNLEIMFFAQQIKPLIVGMDDLGQVRQQGPEEDKGVIVGKDSRALVGLRIERQEEKVGSLGSCQHPGRHPAGDAHCDMFWRSPCPGPLSVLGRLSH